MEREKTDEYIAVLRKLTPTERWEMGRRLYWHAREVRAAALREQHPDWNEQRIAETVRRQFMYAGE